MKRVLHRLEANEYYRVMLTMSLISSCFLARTIRKLKVVTQNESCVVYHWSGVGIANENTRFIKFVMFNLLTFKSPEALQTHWSQLSSQIDQSNSTIAVQSFMKWEAELHAAYDETEPDEMAMKSLVARGSTLNLRVMVAVYAPEKIDKLTGYGCYCFPEAHEK